MPGLDRIIQNIEDEASAKCDSIRQEAQLQAEKIIKTARAQAKQESETLLQAAAGQLGLKKGNAVSGALFKQRNSLLEAKLEIMDEVTAQAKGALDSLPPGDYFHVLFSLILRYAQGREGLMLLNERDLSRLPENFEQHINDALHNGGSIRIRPQPHAIPNGFVLVYGDTEENCTFDALFEAQKDVLQDKLHAILFEEQKDL